MTTEEQDLRFDHPDKAAKFIRSGDHPMRIFRIIEKSVVDVTPEQIARGERMSRIERLNEEKALRKATADVFDEGLQRRHK